VDHTDFFKWLLNSSIQFLGLLQRDCCDATVATYTRGVPAQRLAQISTKKMVDRTLVSLKQATEGFLNNE
jgi:hypothetical protein